MKKFILFTLGLLFAAGAIAQDQYVVLVSMDAFRWDYPQLYRTPNLDKMATEGVSAKSLIPCFPSKTFPNHYSMATGLYPDHHGIVNNSFYAPEFNESFSLSNQKAKYDPKFYGGEPVWNTAERQGVKAASFFWVGSEIPINGRRPSIWKPYDGAVPFSSRVDSVVSWLQRPAAVRPHLVLLYFQEPDAVSHHYGPIGKETKAVVESLDSLIGVLRGKLAALPEGANVNLILVSDHGMAPISIDRVVELAAAIKAEWVDQVQADNPAMNIKAKPQFADSVYHALKRLSHIKAWRCTEVPARLNYGKNPRTLDFTVVADSLWSVTWKLDRSQAAGRYLKGTHGYDTEYQDMHGIFYACGPMFKKGYRAPSFENLNVYNIVCRVLGIVPAPNDGAPGLPDTVLSGQRK
jgi:predicted AlkP superfamily pyrophosphatase or phosphodiesterase